MTFVANTASRNQGRRGHLGLALQASPGTFLPPTHYLRLTGGSGFLPDDLERMSQAFRGTAFEAPAERAGTDYQGRSVNFEASAADLVMMLKANMGMPDAQGVITPVDSTQWDNFFPLPAISGQWFVPGAGHVQFTDGQLHELTLTVPEQRTEMVTGTANFHAGRAVLHPEGEAGFTPAAAVIPSYTGAFGRLHHSVKIAGVTYSPDGASTARFYNPVEPLPATGEYVDGFAPSEQPIGVEFGMAWGRPIPSILEASRTKAFLSYVWRLASGGTEAAPANLIEVTASVQVTAREVPVSPGRVRTTATFRARTQTPGVSPFSITVKAA
ncbi:hypothetical protein [Deinococcus budaensis]|uniref:Uncharacterized protein n=1 Tax=Deinococcus budaensis TaxID=1665626 RepID=A0A7W8GF42_9DEIO|nr:hypothetical protein [Deinococcus budaensis]MBB5234474.1 hypothetical protein [Deinococcus budaensis]